MGQCGGIGIPSVIEEHLLENGIGFILCFREMTVISPEVKSETLPGLNSDTHIFQYAQKRENIGELKGTAHPHLGPCGRAGIRNVSAFQKDPSCGRFVLAGQHVEKSRLAGPVRTDDGLQGEGRHLEIDMVHGHMPAESDGQILGLDDRF